MKKTAVFIASGTGMGADAAKHLSSKGYNIAIMSSSGKGEKLAKDLGVLGFTGSRVRRTGNGGGVKERTVKRPIPTRFQTTRQSKTY